MSQKYQTQNRPRARVAVRSDNTEFSKWLMLAFTALAFLALISMSMASMAHARGAPESFADLAERLLPSVVNISTTQIVDTAERGQQLPQLPQFPPGSPFEKFFKDFFEKNGGQPHRKRKATALGSGFIIDKSGLIVTNNHVIADADEITVILQDDTAIKAEVIGRDPKTDTALLRVKTKHPLKAVPWGNSDVTRVGDWVMAIGNPFGLGGTVTAGIVSARSRDISSGPYDDFIQTDASINKGNSGGPLFNMDGEVIGINSAIYSPPGGNGGSVGIGFSIASNLAKTVIKDLQSYGRTRRGWLGVRIQTVTPEIADSLGMKDASGALVANVSESGPAANAGIKAGDVVLEFNGSKIKKMSNLPRVVAETPINKSVNVKIWREGKVRNMKVRVGELDEKETTQVAEQAGPSKKESRSGKQVAVTELGLSVVPLTDALREQHGISSDVKGVAISKVEPGSDADDKGLQAGDVVVEVNQREVSKPSDVSRQVTNAKRAGRKSVLLLVQNGGGLHFVALKLK